MTLPENIYHLSGISRRGDEMRTQHLLRENKKTPPHLNPTHENPKPKFTGGGVKNRVLPGQATAVSYQGKGTYSYGDGDVLQAIRPGADDHMQFKSLEDRGQAVYHRGHV